MKNNEEAENFIGKAEEFWKAGKYQESIENYNQCLRNADKNSQILSDAFAGRAKVFAEVNQPEKCFESIKHAISACICDDKRKAFEEMMMEYEKKFNLISSDKLSFFKVAHQPNQKIPFISDCLEVRENEIYGRYIMTTKDLQPGDVVVFEEPFYKILDPAFRHTRCSVCLKQNEMCLMPCAKCSHGRSGSRLHASSPSLNRISRAIKKYTFCINV